MQPANAMFRTFMYFLFFILAVVAIFNFIIYRGELPPFMALQSVRGIGEACDEQNICQEPLQCISNMCVLVVTEKGQMCNNIELKCEQPLICHNNRCKEKVGKDKPCDERSMNTCAGESFCLDGVCRVIA